jgi:hypothetical protein
MAENPNVDPNAPETPEAARDAGNRPDNPAAPDRPDNPLAEDIARDAAEGNTREGEGATAGRGNKRGGGVTRPR